jgi:hypothetical protein
MQVPQSISAGTRLRPATKRQRGIPNRDGRLDPAASCSDQGRDRQTIQKTAPSPPATAHLPGAFAYCRSSDENHRFQDNRPADHRALERVNNYSIPSDEARRASPARQRRDGPYIRRAFRVSLLAESRFVVSSPLGGKSNYAETWTSVVARRQSTSFS